MLQPDPDRPKWPMFLYMVGGISFLFSAPKGLDRGRPVDLATAPYGWIALLIAVMSLGLFAALGGVTEYRSWDDDDRKGFWQEIAWFLVLTLAGTAVTLPVSAWARWDFGGGVFLMIVPWLAFKGVQWRSRQRARVWE